MPAHAILSASSSKRWLACPPSARLCEKYEDTSSEFALEGTDAHSLCEYKLRHYLGIKARNPTEDLTYYNEEMETCAEDYAQYVTALYEAAKQNGTEPILLVEQRLDFSKYVPQGFGTGDAVLIADGKLTVVDFKYGKGVLVESEGNSQMMLYALGALELFDGIYDITDVDMTIFQPRRANISTYSITKDALLEWANNTLVPRAKLAFEGKGEFCAGDHCKFCKAKATCRKRAECNLELAKYDFAPPDTLTDVEVEAVLAKADELAAWAEDVKEYAFNAALSGKEWSDWKLVEGRSNRKYINADVAAAKVESAGYNPYEKKILGITAMQKMLGKTKFEELLGGLIEKPMGKPTLVKRSDKRPGLKNTAVSGKFACEFTDSVEIFSTENKAKRF